MSIPPVLRLSIMPFIGCALLLGAYLWSQRELKLRFWGQPADGQLIGMVLEGEKTSDLLAGLDSTLVLTLANGDGVEAHFVNYELRSSRVLSAGARGDDKNNSAPFASDQPDASTSGSSQQLSDDRQALLVEIVRGNAEIVRWALLRESRRAPEPTRVVRIEKTEVITGYLEVPKVPEVFGLQNGRLLLNTNETASPYAGEVRIHAVFDSTDPDLLKAQKGDPLIDYSYERNGKLLSPEKKDFFLFAEPYSTQFRPVFAFEANGTTVARLSHIGRHGGPTLALRLFGPCHVYYDQNHPEDAVVTAMPGPVGDDPLGWFSRYCEGLFGQWGSTALMVIAGLAFIVTGLILISLAVFPSRNIPGLEESSSPE